jgi:DNA-binding response OmpR family regulator
MERNRVLVVDDDVATAEVVRLCLEQEGFSVWTATDSLSASRAVAAGHLDLILLDVMLPDIDGWELCAMIRSLPDPGISKTPIVMLTSRSKEEDRIRGLRAGADDYITKPFDPDEIVRKVRNLLTPM